VTHAGGGCFVCNPDIGHQRSSTLPHSVQTRFFQSREENVVQPG
jgi:hypothetical protein